MSCALPTTSHEAVGPFVFLDHFQPAPARAETLPAHPHAGIEVMTYLLEGGSEHRDSKGHRGTVRSGGAQWMRAGSGILHAETVLPELGATVHGLQLWARLPLSLQDTEPLYRSFNAEDVPQWHKDGNLLRLLAGNMQGHTGALALALPAFMLHIDLAANAHLQLTLPDPDFEYGVYAIEASAGSLRLDNTMSLSRGSFARLRPRTQKILGKRGFIRQYRPTYFEA